MNINLSSYWIHDLSPFLWKFPEPYSDWGPGGIRWYGIAYFGIFNSIYPSSDSMENRPLRSRANHESNDIPNLGVLLGGRIGYAFLYQGSVD